MTVSTAEYLAGVVRRMSPVTAMGGSLRSSYLVAVADVMGEAFFTKSTVSLSVRILVKNEEFAPLSNSQANKMTPCFIGDVKFFKNRIIVNSTFRMCYLSARCPAEGTS